MFGLNYDKGFRPMGTGGGYMINTGGSGGANGNRGAEEMALARARAGWDKDSQNRGFANSVQLQGMNNDLQRYLGDQGNATARYTADQSNASARLATTLQHQLGMTGLNNQQGRFDSVWGMIKDPFSKALSGFGGSGGYQGSGPVGGPQPGINASPIYSQSQIQQQVNAGKAAGDTRAEGDVARMRQSMAARGFGQGPAAFDLERGIRGKALASSMANERETRMGAAGQNAEHVLKAQMGQEEQYRNRQQEDIDRKTKYMSSFAGLLGSIGGLV
jgi:hypothetical protein